MSAPPIMSRDIPLGLIDPDPDQPRKHFDPAALDELAGSMAANGQAVPIMVRPTGDRFAIVHGERRWRAAAALGWPTVRGEVRELDAEAARWLALIENIQRADLTPTEEAHAYQARLAEGLTQAELGRRIGKTQSAIAQKLRLLSLPAPVSVYLERGALTEGHARQLLRIRKTYGAMADGTEPNRELRPVTQANAAPPILTTEGTPIREGPDPERAGDDGDRFAVFCLLRDIRPEDNPPVWIASDRSLPIQPALTAGCEAFPRWLEATDFRPPSWGVAAFWWASLAVRTELSVADLALYLDRWRQRFLGNLAWAVVRGLEAPRGRGLSPDAQEAWACLSDLRHAGARDLAANLPPERGVELAEMIAGGNWSLPSNLQPWGFGHSRYEALLDGGSAV